jgi:hypothetical protein
MDNLPILKDVFSDKPTASLSTFPFPLFAGFLVLLSEEGGLARFVFNMSIEDT